MLPRHATAPAGASMKVSAPRAGDVRVGVFSSDPAAMDAFHGFDPESGILYQAMNDSLVYLDNEGLLRPGLATSWRRVDALSVELDLRRGVRFHDGAPFTARDVVATLEAQLDPANRAFNGQGILSTIARCEALAPFRVRLTTRRPDAMLMHRLPIASAVYPADVLLSEGPQAFLKRPIGTGAYRFVRWDRGQQIILERNPEHWAATSNAERLIFPILPQKDLADALRAGAIDVAFNLEPSDAVRLQHGPGLNVKRRMAALVHWFLLSTRGPLADRRVREALNLAVNPSLLAEIAEHGWASPQASLLTPGAVGHNPSLKPHPYDPERARRLLREAGYAEGFKLRGLVADTSSAHFHLIRLFLERVGVQLEAEFLPRPLWMQRLTGKLSGAQLDVDFAMASVDNFTLHGLFPHTIFLHSKGAFSLANDPEYDRRFEAAAAQVEPEAAEAAIRDLERYARDQALMLFTVRHDLHAATREGFDVPLSIAGHLGYEALWRIQREHSRATPAPTMTALQGEVGPDIQRILDATAVPGVLREMSDDAVEDPVLREIWRNIRLHHVRFQVQSDRMLRTLVTQITAQSNLENVLRSTHEVGILGLADDGRVLFENVGYAHVMGAPGETPLDAVLREGGRPVWAEIRHKTEAQGACAQVVDAVGLDGRARRVFLTVTRAVNEVGTGIGYVCVLADHSREEERLRFKQEMDVARRIQLSLVPSLDACPDAVGHMDPAEEVGGDYYDVITDADGHTWYALGDVSGHGLTSGLIMLMTQSVVQAVLRSTPGVRGEQVLTTLNQVLLENLKRLGESYHLTLTLVQSLGLGRYRVVGAHEELLVHRAASGEVERREVEGLWLGLLEDIEGSFSPFELQLDPGDTVLLFTDGVTEAASPDEALYGLDRLCARVAEAAPEGPEALRARIMADVEAFMGPKYDDISLLIFQEAAR